MAKDEIKDINTLPQDLFTQILDKYSIFSTEELTKMRRVNKHWKATIESLSLWKNVFNNSGLGSKQAFEKYLRFKQAEYEYKLQKNGKAEDFLEWIVYTGDTDLLDSFLETNKLYPIKIKAFFSDSFDASEAEEVRLEEKLPVINLEYYHLIICLSSNLTVRSCHIGFCDNNDKYVFKLPSNCEEISNYISSNIKIPGFLENKEKDPTLCTLVARGVQSEQNVKLPENPFTMVEFPLPMIRKDLYESGLTYTPLFFAALGGHSKMVKYLLQNGANLLCHIHLNNGFIQITDITNEILKERIGFKHEINLDVFAMLYCAYAEVRFNDFESSTDKSTMNFAFSMLISKGVTDPQAIMSQLGISLPSNHKKFSSDTPSECEKHLRLAKGYSPKVFEEYATDIVKKKEGWQVKQSASLKEDYIDMVQRVHTEENRETMDLEESNPYEMKM